MTISPLEIEIPYATDVQVTDDTLTVDLSDGRSISVPISWFPRLVQATESERKNWRLIGKGHEIHWDDVDEDISVEGLLAGRHSGESQAFLKRWLQSRMARPSTARFDNNALEMTLAKPARPSSGLAFNKVNDGIDYYNYEVPGHPPGADGGKITVFVKAVQN